ncbi:MAG: DUF2808 domain-containing protein [Leptolyngbyaceae cyanobacterium bins.302]|nr:DUF2808 domain-containing protein [Leptolyngbyaceae cyanobacterium bins.302]
MRQISVVLTLSILAVVLSPWAIAKKSVAPVAADPISSDKTLVVASPASGDRALSNQQHTFRMVLPARAGEKFSMLSLTLQSREPGGIPIPFDVKTAQVSVGAANGQEKAIAVHQTWVDETGTLWIEFKPSLPAKTQLKLSLAARKLTNQTAYDYGIAAYADSDYPAAVFVESGVVTIQ